MLPHLKMTNIVVVEIPISEIEFALGDLDADASEQQMVAQCEQHLEAEGIEFERKQQDGYIRFELKPSRIETAEQVHWSMYDFLAQL